MRPSYALLQDFLKISFSLGNDGEGENEEEGEKDGIKHKDSFVAEPGAPRLEKVRHSLNKLERKRNDYLYEKHVIGRVSNRRRDIVKELACISSRKVPFKWQRGNKIGTVMIKNSQAFLCCLSPVSAVYSIKTYFRGKETQRNILSHLLSLKNPYSPLLFRGDS